MQFTKLCGDTVTMGINRDTYLSLLSVCTNVVTKAMYFSLRNLDYVLQFASPVQTSLELT